MAVDFKKIKLLLETVAIEEKDANIKAYLTWSNHVLDIKKQKEEPILPSENTTPPNLEEEDKKVAATLIHLALTKGAGNDEAGRLKNGKAWLTAEIKLLAGLEQGEFNIRITTFTIQRESIKDLEETSDPIDEYNKRLEQDENAETVVTALKAIQKGVQAGTFTLTDAIAELERVGDYVKLKNINTVTALTDTDGQKKRVLAILKKVTEAQTDETDKLGEAEALQAVLNYITTQTTNNSGTELRNIVRAMGEGDSVNTAITAGRNNVLSITDPKDIVAELETILNQREGTPNSEELNDVAELTDEDITSYNNKAVNVTSALGVNTTDLEIDDKKVVLRLLRDALLKGKGASEDERRKNGLRWLRIRLNKVDPSKKEDLDRLLNDAKNATNNSLNEAHAKGDLELTHPDDVADAVYDAIMGVLDYQGNSNELTAKSKETLADISKLDKGTINDSEKLKTFAKETLKINVDSISFNDLAAVAIILKDTLAGDKGKGASEDKRRENAALWLLVRICKGTFKEKKEDKITLPEKELRTIAKDAKGAEYNTLDEILAQEQLQKKGAIGRFIQWIDGKLENRPVLKGILLALALVSVGVLIGGVFFLNFNTFGGASQLLGVTGFWTMATGLAMAAAMHFLPNKFYETIPVINELHKFKQKYPLVVAGLKIAVGITAAVFFGIYINDFLALPTVFFEPITALSRVIPIGFAAAVGLGSGVADVHKNFRGKGRIGQQQNTSEDKVVLKNARKNSVRRALKKKDNNNDIQIASSNPMNRPAEVVDTLTNQVQEVSNMPNEVDAITSTGFLSALCCPINKGVALVKKPFKAKQKNDSNIVRPSLEL